MKMPLDTEVELGRDHIVLDGEPPPLPPKGHSSPSVFGPCLLWPLGMGVGLSPGHNVLDGDPAPPRGTPQFSAHVCCGRTAGWIKMPLSTKVGLGLRDIVLNGDPALLP